MHLFISVFLILFSGWTLSSHFCVFLGLNLQALLWIAPFVVSALSAVYYMLPKIKNNHLHSQYSPERTLSRHNKTLSIFGLTILTASLIALHVSWIAFCALSVSLLVFCLVGSKLDQSFALKPTIRSIRKVYSLIVALIALSAVILAYTVSRSDLDDSFYVAVASYASSNPADAIMATDPMLGEHNFPLMLPSHPFASFELLSGALAYLLSIPAMDVYYIYLLPVCVVASVVAIFLLTQEMIPSHSLLAGVLALLLILLLGEMHRSSANFSFVRLFQGKAVFLSVIVPTIFYLTARLFSERASLADLFLLACCQVSAIGFTNFGMLMAPIVGFSALISNLPLALQGSRKKLYYAFTILLIPLPYLINVARQSNGSPILNFASEPPAQVWISVFGSHQQYLVGFLILVGPILAKDTVTRWRMAIPPLLLFAIYLNPLFAGLISKYVTTPPVYWRVVWSFPILIFSAVSCCMIIVSSFETNGSRLVKVALSFVLIVLSLYALPFNTLRFDNIGPIEGFATWKIPTAHLAVAEKAMGIDHKKGRLLAPDEIAGVISRFEHHPPLISTRGLYLDLMRPLIGEAESIPRKILYDFAIGNGPLQMDKLRAALRSLDVSIIVLRSNLETSSVFALLESEGFEQRALINAYSIWAKPTL